MPSTNRLRAYTVILLSTLSGGGSLLLFGAFLIAGPFPAVRLNISESQALLWDGFLSALFFLQHSGMVRSSFHRWFSSLLPAHYYSATYSLASGIVLAAVVLLWQPSPRILFEVRGLLLLPFHAASFLAVAGFLWGVLSLGAFDPFGRIPILFHLNDKRRAPRLVVRGAYLWVRHPLYFFTLVLLWAAPSVSADRLLFNALWTSWIVLGSYLEERDLVAEYGEDYRRYQDTVPMLIPWRGPAGRNYRASVK